MDDTTINATSISIAAFSILVRFLVLIIFVML